MKSPRQPFSYHLENSQGFTLIETMIALLVFTLGILAIMTLNVSSTNGFTRSGITSTEVNRTTLNIETLKEASYSNEAVFPEEQTTPMGTMGTDGDTINYYNSVDTVVKDTKLIVLENKAIHGGSASNTYELYFIKPLIE
ncbi:MAG: prepilin-type N-terminal cleavage/methylation domain-containing protein [Desulfobacteraceae bacterium]|jgi:prepilin-type N-terminal cleavage/methylation domain-containing protein